MAIKRQVRCTYCAVFKNGEQLDLREIIGFYDDYNEFRKRILENKSAPSTIKTQILPVDVPQYIEWIRKFLIEEKKK